MLPWSSHPFGIGSTDVPGHDPSELEGLSKLEVLVRLAGVEDTEGLHLDGLGRHLLTDLQRNVQSLERSLRKKQPLKYFL